MADDDEDFLHAMQTILHYAGFRVDIAADGEKALKEIKKHKYDLLVTDVFMPKIDGITLFRKARKTRKAKTLPVIFMSAFSALEKLDARKKEIVQTAGAYLEKPFQTNEFVEIVQKLMSGTPLPPNINSQRRNHQ